jgi:hypothetical protein
MESTEFRAGDVPTTLFREIAAAAEPAPVTEDVSIICHENQVPPFVEAELVRLYGHIFSSLLQFRVYGELTADTSTYVVRRAGVVVTLLLYRREKNLVKVLNQSIRISNDDMRRFADHIFSIYPSVTTISFHAVQPDIDGLRYPHQRFNCADDIVIALPDAQQAYLASLGKNMRRNIRRYTDRLTRSFPSFHVEFHACENADEQQIRTIIGFNRARMAGKNKVSTLDELESDRIVQLTKACGLLSVAMIDGRICAGGIAYRIGDNFFLYVIAHDPAYDDYWVGILTCYLTICECIARGGKAFHFLWGRYDYKFALGAVLHTLDHVDVYRSWTMYMLNSHTIARTALDREIYRLKFALLDMARRKDSAAARFVSQVVTRLRRAKRFIDGKLSRERTEPLRNETP